MVVGFIDRHVIFLDPSLGCFSISAFAGAAWAALTVPLMRAAIVARQRAADAQLTKLVGSWLW